MITSPHAKNPLEELDQSKKQSGPSDPFEEIPKRLKYEPAYASRMVEAMTAAIETKYKHVEAWGNNSNLLGRIGDVYAALSTEAAEVVDTMTVGAFGGLGPNTFSPIRNDAYLERLTSDETVPVDSAVEPIHDVGTQEQMAQEARALIDSSFGLSDDNFITTA
jgi:hypothetical protein